MKKIGILLGFCLVMALVPTFMPQPALAHTGSGTMADPYMIYDVNDLQDMQNHLSSCWKLANDIDASATSGWNGGAGFVPISTFSGNFDGNYYNIDGLFINRGANNQALFGYVKGFGSRSIIANVTMTNAYIATSGTILRTAILVAQAETCNITNCIVSGSVIGYSCVGGLVALINDSSVSISRCASYGSVLGSVYVGGLVGFVGGTYSASITNSYSRASATASWQHAGGFTDGSSINSIITNCYSTGVVSCPSHPSDRGGFACGVTPCTNCFWDIQTSGISTSSCGTGKNTTNMKTQSTFTNAGWDFDTVWGIGGAVNDGYPYLLWWYNPPVIISDVNQVVWFQPNDIIEGTTLPNRAQNGTLIDGIITWGANPAGITVTHGELIPEEEYDFEPVMPDSRDIIKPEPTNPVGDVDLDRLHDNPLSPLIGIFVAPRVLTERLVWLLFAWFVVIAAMFAVHLGPDTHKDSEKPQHFILTTITGLGLSILFYSMGIFNWGVIALMAIGLICAIIWERQPVL